MAIEDIFRALEEQADAEVSEILRIAQVQADAIVQEAKDEANRVTEARVHAAEEAVRARSAKAVNAARLEVRRGLASVRDSAVDAVFVEASARLGKLRGTAGYEPVFKALVAEALANIDEPCELRVAPEDVALAKAAVGSGVEVTVSPSLETIGGVVVAYDGGRVVRMNTFESRLDKVRGLAQASVAEVLTS
jgi:vacuolar-type H+-ATPase subunit E/Vma4